MAGIQLTGVAKSYGAADVIKAVNLTVDNGSFTVIVGPSGCGKSTLLRIIAGLETFNFGEIRIDNQIVNDVDAADRGVAMVFQSYALYPHMTVAQNMGFALRMQRLPKPQIEERVRRAAEILQLTPMLHRKPRQLSGGQRQRVAIGRAIVRDPKVFLFDEPLSNLDADLRVQMRIEIAQLHKRLGNTIVYVTHDQIEAMTLADKIVVMRDGQVEQVGSPTQLYEDPENVFVAGFIGSPRMNLLRGVVRENGRIVVSGQEFAVPLDSCPQADEGVTVGIRPKYFDEPDEGIGANLRAMVEVVENLGETNHLHCRLSDGQSLIVERRKLAGLTSDASLTVSFAPHRALVFSADGRRVR